MQNINVFRRALSGLHLLWQIIFSFICLHGLNVIHPFLSFNTAEAAESFSDATERKGRAVPPLILAHPAMQNHAAWYFYQAEFRRAGFSQIHYFEYSCRETSLSAAAGRLAELVEDVIRNNPGVKPVLIGASLGGLVARESLCFLADPACVAGLITLACPHKGSRLAKLVPKKLLPLLHGVSYNSRMIQKLEDKERSVFSPVLKTAFFSLSDEMVKPVSALRPAANQGWREVETEPLSHMSIMLNTSTIKSVINEIRRFQKIFGNDRAA